MRRKGTYPIDKDYLTLVKTRKYATENRFTGHNSLHHIQTLRVTKCCRDMFICYFDFE